MRHCRGFTLNSIRNCNNQGLEPMLSRNAYFHIGANFQLDLPMRLLSAKSYREQGNLVLGGDKQFLLKSKFYLD